MTTATQTPRNYRIVAALDGSEYAEIVLEHAFDHAARHGDVDLHLLSVVADPSEVDATKRWLAQTSLECLDAFSEHRGAWRTRLHVRVGKAEDEIPNLAAELAAELLVIGNFGIHPRRRPIAEAVVARAICPTLVVNLSGRVVSPVEQCPACVAIRETTDGERWFCAEHTSDRPLHLSTLLPTSWTVGQGGPMW